jgi:hypothetical protein
MFDSDIQMAVSAPDDIPSNFNHKSAEIKMDKPVSPVKSEVSNLTRLYTVSSSIFVL